MATPKETIWELDPHTVAKHAILRGYLKAWFPILGRHYRRVVYIDGFSGPGRYLGGEPGSPLVAIDVAKAHATRLSGEVRFWFIEENEDRARHLNSELAKLDLPEKFKVKVEIGRFDESLTSVLDDLDAQFRKPAPVFAFVDPFGFKGVPFELMRRILGHPRCEVFITFMVDSINRWLEHPQEEVVSHIAGAFGTDEAKRIAQEPGERIEKLRELYQSQLKSVAKFVRYFEMRDRNDRVQYYLFFATNHELGHVRMKGAMWGVDRGGTFRFSDATDPSQRVLFAFDPVPPLLKQLKSEFVGKSMVTGGQVRSFVEDRTAFLKSHMTDALRRAESTGDVKVEPLKTDGKKRRANTFPDDAQLEFVRNRPVSRKLF